MDEKRNDQPTPMREEGKPPEPIHDDDTAVQKDGATGKTSDEGPVSPSFPTTIQGWTDKALDFLAHASNETLGACLVGLGASTYVVLGRVGLVVIGVAGGVVLHASWDGIRNDNRDEATKLAEQIRRRQAGAEVAKRALEWRSASSTGDIGEEAKIYFNQSLDFSRFEPETAAALDTFTEAVIKDYVYYWYGPTLPGENTFPASCKRTLMAFILSLTGHLGRKRPADAFLDFVTNASSIIIVFLNELAAALNASPNSPANEAISAYLELKPESSLAYMLNQEGQEAKLANAAEDILQAYLDPKAYNFPPSHVFLKEILAQLVLGSTLTTCSKPDWINDWIVYGLEESQTTKDVMDIVDAGVHQRDEAAKSQQHNPHDLAPGHLSEKAKDNVSKLGQPGSDHQRHVSRAEEAMDEAMQEAKRLTQLMIEEDEKRTRDEQQQQQSPAAAASSSEDLSEATTQGAPTPTSSQSEHEQQEEETVAWDKDSMTTDETPTPSEEKLVTPTSQPFTNFDQMVPSARPTALSDGLNGQSLPPAQLTLHNASVSIIDDSDLSDRTSMKAKPTTDYLIQVEPTSSAFRGWMTARKYADFETLHEVLRRISVITGVTGFTESHQELPKWKSNTKATLRVELERYLADAVRLQPLADSEGMKRFLEKDQGLIKSPTERNKGFGWPTPDAFGKFGGDMMTAFTKAPKQVAGGGKAVFGGVAGLVGAGGGAKRPRQAPGNLSRTSSSSMLEGHQSKPSLGQPLQTGSQFGSLAAARQSQDSLRTPARPSLDRRVSGESATSTDWRLPPGSSLRRTSTEATGAEASAPSIVSPTASSGSKGRLVDDDQAVHLPPPPSEMPEDYSSPTRSSRQSTDTYRSSNIDQRMSGSFEREQDAPLKPPRSFASKSDVKAKPPLSDSETSVAVELMFAVVNELYTLSSAWNFRKTLLSAAKNYLLRPGNPQLTTIRDMLQTSMLDNNLSDEGLSKLICKMRENGLPTEEEMEVWKRNYPEKTEEQKEELRIKARNLLVTKGMPQALTSVMGAAASGEALGRVFDCLQMERVSRGLVFGLMLQALKVVTH